ncbi:MULTISPECIES: substrate-binding domain-containing protein [unclassified Shinella]|uniref:substrate-binding domain-containing protein n=1 Tax=unclassified Shinella TaxID=2643062 RepID=UPI00225D79B7|nr:MULTISPECIES: substrate-binding domain-containing protein [unclassified Shinella]MCO5139081.1 substrate-binding domain-containing protein [Shinella sp.]MDC7256189.1 substrate-binding domain-containing protein [Shinella sp. YE25]CAI0339038.1 putative rhizopine-binding protein [Rhizobiaceae bacterium]CAK7257456.1 putative rhizopine-binding protein [Shinella sp. WSC3-e]
MLNLRKVAFAAAAVTTLFCSTLAARADDIGVSMPYFDDVWLTNLRNSIASNAEKAGFGVQAEDAQGDVSKQADQVNNLIASGVKALIVSPVDTSATQPMTAAAQAAGIPLIYVARKPDQDLPQNVIYVGSDERTSGVMQAEEFAKQLNGKGRVVIFQGELAVNTTTVRTGGIDTVLAKYPDIEVIQKPSANYQRQQASDIMTNILSSGEHVDGVIANNDEMAIGAILATIAAGADPKSIVFAGIDGTGEALHQMAEGNLDITVFHNAKGQGEKAVDAVTRMVKGEAVEPVYWVPFELVTKANEAEYASR